MSEAITKEAAARFGDLADRLRMHPGVTPDQVAHFLVKLMFCMFGEDIGLLPPKLFEKILESGKTKPDAPFPPAPDGWVNFDPGPDQFAPSAIDLRILNEKVAGETGFISAKGEDFVLGNGQPKKFWGVNAGPAVMDMPRKYVDQLAKFLARRGVNLGRPSRR